MKAVSWNVNGLRACLNKGFADVVRELDPDFFCVQETKLQAGQLDLTLPGYTSYWDYAEKKGYSGTMILAKKPPLSVSLGIGDEEHGHEGRCVTLEYPAFYMVTLYSPNSQDGLRRLPYRLSFEEALRRYLAGLDAKKPVILCGDLNVAHQEIDLKNPGPNRGNAGFSRRGAGGVRTPARRRLYRYLPPAPPGSNRGIQLVVLSLQRPAEQRGMADRLFSRQRPAGAAGGTADIASLFWVRTIGPVLLELAD